MFPEKIPGVKVVKSTVRASLSGKYITATIAALLPIFAFCLLSVITTCAYDVLPLKAGICAIVVAVIVAIFAIFPLALGTLRFFWRLTDGICEEPSEVFYYFNSFACYKRALKSVLFVIFKFSTTFVPCMLPYFITVLLSSSWVYRFLGTEVPLWVAGIVLLSAFLKYAGLFLGLILFLRHYLFVAVVVMDDNLHIYEAAHIGTMVSSMSIGAFATLIISLLGWVLLSFLVAPMIYTMPFIIGCYVVHSRYAIVNYNQTLEFYSKEQI